MYRLAQRERCGSARNVSARVLINVEGRLRAFSAGSVSDHSLGTCLNPSFAVRRNVKNAAGQHICASLPFPHDPDRN